MEASNLIGPAVVAAIVSGFVAVVGSLLSRSTTIKMHSERIAADQALAIKKVDADIALAKQKFEYDRGQAVFRRRFELAEQLLADSYHFRSLMAFVRNGFAWGSEGEGRKGSENETEKIKRLRNTYFVPQERLRREEPFLAAMFARRTTCEAHFGPIADHAFTLFLESLNRVRTSSSLLIEWAQEYEQVDKAVTKELLHDLWQPMARHAEKDEIGNKIDDAVAAIEGLCRPVLEWGSAS